MNNLDLCRNKDDFDIHFEDMRIKVKRINPIIGAEVLGIDLNKQLSAELYNLIHDLLVEYKVVFFSNQNINSKKFVRFASGLGTILKHPFKMNPEKGNPDALRVFHTRENPSKINSWHSDATYLATPPDATLLRSLVLPSCGGDTLFANMEAAYQNLDDQAKEEIENLIGIHDMWYFRQSLRKRGMSEEKLEWFSKKYPLSYHPIVKTHPASGRKCIFVNKGFTIGIKGLDESKSKPLLQKLFLTAWQPEIQCRFKWKIGNVAIWDNRSSQHYPVADYWPETRGMERITVALNK